MATKYYTTMSSLWIFMFLAILDTTRRSYVKGLPILDKNSFGQKPKGTIKTIEALEVGDIIDCVDMYKQPAFDNPLLSNLKVARSPFSSSFNKTTTPQLKLVQTWNRYGECPKGTIPIKRTSNTNGIVHRKYPNDDPNNREYATVRQRFKKSNGGQAMFNLWNPLVASAGEFSLSQMWVSSGDGGHLNTVEAGWTVLPSLFHDARTRLFIYWTRDGYNRTGCYNLLCRDFVQLSDYPQMAIGGALEPISVYDGHSVSLLIRFHRTQVGDWWLVVGDRELGYYPHQLFTSLRNGADQISFGGEIVNLQLRQRHTSTAMGSGQFSREGYRKACFISNIKVANNKHEWVNPHLEIQGVTKPDCYDLTFGPSGTPLESHFYFGGGPGRLSHGCE